jgi:hypothetical protein
LGQLSFKKREQNRFYPRSYEKASKTDKGVYGVPKGAPVWSKTDKGVYRGFALVWSKTDKGVYGGFAPVLIIIY